MTEDTSVYQLFCDAEAPQKPSTRKRANSNTEGWCLVGTHHEFRAMMLAIKGLAERAGHHTYTRYRICHARAAGTV